VDQSGMATLLFLKSDSICLGYFVFKIPTQSALATLFFEILNQSALATLFLKFSVNLLWLLCFSNSESICSGYFVFKILIQSALATLFLKF
jgi:hypothetical protein